MALRVGVVGVRFGTTVHIPAFQSEGLDVVAVCARRQERAASAAERFSIPEVYTDWEEMIDREDLDIVSIASPVPLHFPMAKAALLSGRHVLCEKPFTTNALEARELAELAASKGLTAMMGHEFRFTSGRMRAKELIEQGYIGDLRLAIVRVLFDRGPSEPGEFNELADDASTGAGILWNQGSHYLDALRHFFGEVHSVTGHAVTLVPERVRLGERVLADAEDTFMATLEFETGGYAEIIVSRVLPFSADAGIEIYGSKGTLITPQTMANPPSRGYVLGAQVGEDGLVDLEIPHRLEQIEDDRDDRMSPFRLLIREFVRGITEHVSPSPNFVDGYRCQQVLDAIRASTKNAKTVVIAGEPGASRA
jgi:predicted dehydrogenase